MRKFQITGVLKGRDFPHDSGRELSFIIYAKDKKEVSEEMKTYNWIFWQGEELGIGF